MKKPKPRPFVVCGQHASGPDWDYKRHFYSDGRVVEKIKGEVPDGIRHMLDTGHHGESDELSDPAEYAKNLTDLIASTRRPPRR